MVNKSTSIITERGQTFSSARWQPGCIFRLYCGSTVWPASQCNPQTIPCCYSIARTAVVVPPLQTLVIACVSCTLFILQASSPNHIFVDDLLPIIYLPKDVQIFTSSSFCRFRSTSRQGGSPETHTHKKRCSLM